MNANQRRTIHMLLSPDAAGGQVTDPHAPLAGTGPGGSRAGYAGLVRAMGRRGDYDVTAYSTFRERRERIDGVEYRRLDDRADFGEADVVFAYYDVRELLRVPWRDGRLRVGSHHTLNPYAAWPCIDVNTAPSAWAAEFLARGYRPLDAWEVLPNALEGVDHAERRPVAGRVLWQTSPDRGLHNLLAVWPEIRARVPGATLEITGTPEAMARTYLRDEWRGTSEARMAERLSDGLVLAQRAGGVTLLGRVTRERMLQALSEASCCAYPFEVYAPCETWSISVMEAMAIGAPVVMSPVDALESLWGKHAVMALPTSHPCWRESFVGRVLDVLTRRVPVDSITGAAREYARQFTFDRAADALHGIVEKYLPRMTAKEVA